MEVATSDSQGKALSGADKVLHGNEYQRVLDRMRAIEDQYESHQGRSEWRQKDKDEWIKLVARKKELKELLGVIV